jgi:hypothetical protein
MLLTDVRQESIVKRIEEVLSVLMEENSLFKEDFNSSEMVTHLAEVFGNT